MTPVIVEALCSLDLVVRQQAGAGTPRSSRIWLSLVCRVPHLKVFTGPGTFFVALGCGSPSA